MDSAHQEVDKRLKQTERKINQIYRRAQKEIDKKTSDFFEASARRDEKMKAKVESGAMSQEDYEAWRNGQLMTGQRYQQMQKQVAAELTNASKTAAAYVNGQIPEIYALGYNALEDTVNGIGGYSFTLVDAHTVRHLATEDKTLLPYKYVNEKKEERWVTQRVNSEVLQGVLQGESVQKIAKRLRSVTEMDKASSMRNARTTTTSAENKGRMDSYHDAEKQGIVLRKRWMATHDSRTREEHLALDGVTIDVDEPFENDFGEIMYPGDPDAAPANVYNCRCTLISVIKGFVKPETDKAKKPLALEEAQEEEAKKPEEEAVDEITKKIEQMENAGEYDDEKQNLLPLTNDNGEYPASKMYTEIPDEKARRLETEKTVKVSDLYTEQKEVFVSNLEYLAESFDGMRISGIPTEDYSVGITVAKYDGKLVVVDGNNRVNLAILKGQDEIDVMFVDLDELKKKKKR